MSGLTGTWDTEDRGSNDFEQAGDLYRLIDEPAKQRLVENIAGGLAQVHAHGIIERSISHFRNADPDYGDRIAKAIVALGT